MPVYHVSLSGGSDAASGAELTPLASLEYALETKAAAGDTILLRGGAYGDDGAGIWKSASDKQILVNKNITVSSYPGEPVSINIPSDTTSAGLFYLGGAWVFNGIDFLNTNSVSSYLARFEYNSPTSLTYNDCNVDWNNKAQPIFRPGTGLTANDVSIYLKRCKIKNVPASTAIVSNAITNGRTCNLFVSACLLKDIGWIASNAVSKTLNASLVNNTIINPKSAQLLYAIQAGDSGVIKNNIIVDPNDSNYPLLMQLMTTDNWAIENNNMYRALTTDPGGQLDNLCLINSTELYPLQSTMYYIQPTFVDAANDDYSLVSDGYLSGRGDVDSLPAGGDINGNNWTGADIGAFRNPESVPRFPQINTGTIAFVGDSIAQGMGNEAKANGTLAPLTVVGDGVLGSAIGGSRGETAMLLIDRAMITWRPEYVVIRTWANNFPEGANVPTNITAQQASTLTLQLINKVRHWGAIPIVIGLTGAASATEAGQIADANALDSDMRIMCSGNNVLYDYPIARMRFNSSWNLAVASGGYFGVTGLSGNLHPATEGQELLVSLVEDLIKNQKGYYITEAGTSIVGSQPGPATSRYPLSRLGLNAQESLPALTDVTGGTPVTVVPLINDGPPRNNITRLTGTSTTIDPAGTYQFADTNAWREVTGWTAGTANFGFDENGVPIPFTGQQAIDAGIGPRLYCGSKGIAGYTVDQDEEPRPKDQVIKEILKIGS